MKKMNKKGFTLVEIMIVVAIIGLLAAIGIPSILNAMEKSKISAMARNVAEVNKAKAQLTLPTGTAGGQDAKDADPVAGTLLTELNALLHVSGPAALAVGTNTMDYGATIGASAFYK